MRGQIIQFDEITGFGVIHAEDGVRYTFSRTDLLPLRPVQPGLAVEFQPRSTAAQMVQVVAGAAAGRATAAATTDAPDDLSIIGYMMKCLRLSFNGKGRARRKEYWSFWLLSVAYAAVVFLVIGALFFDGDYERFITNMRSANPDLDAGVALLLLIAPIMPASISVSARRLHDLGLNGWLYLLSLIPTIGGLAMLVAALIPSREGANAYGPYPKPAN